MEAGSPKRGDSIFFSSGLPEEGKDIFSLFERREGEREGRASARVLWAYDKLLDLSPPSAKRRKKRKRGKGPMKGCARWEGLFCTRGINGSKPSPRSSSLLKQGTESLIGGGKGEHHAGLAPVGERGELADCCICRGVRYYSANLCCFL